MVAALSVSAQDVKRARPVGWENIVEGGRFMDRFEPSPLIGEPTSACWGGENVHPRDVLNGIEEKDWSYWGGNIVKEGDTYHLFVARWREDSPKGHMQWPWSEVVHAVSNRPDGGFKVMEVLGRGHNPEAFRCKDGSWNVYCIVPGREAARVYHAPTLNGPWEPLKRMGLDLNGFKMIEGESNFSFCSRADGSVLAVCRGGGIWLSPDGIAPFKMIHGRVYPKVAGRFEDPVLWHDRVQYHLIVNDWLGRVAWYLTSPDGLDWQTMPGEAYTPGIAKYRDAEGKVHLNDWYKYERLKVLQDEYGRVIQANFAVIDILKWKDKSNDIHSSKNITIPVNPGRLAKAVAVGEKEVTVTIAAEKDFAPAKDLDQTSIILGTQNDVAFGKGVKVKSAKNQPNGDVALTFGLPENRETVMKLFGKETSGRIFFATFRLDGQTL